MSLCIGFHLCLTLLLICSWACVFFKLFFGMTLIVYLTVKDLVAYVCLHCNIFKNLQVKFTSFIYYPVILLSENRFEGFFLWCHLVLSSNSLVFNGCVIFQDDKWYFFPPILIIFSFINSYFYCISVSMLLVISGTIY